MKSLKQNASQPNFLVGFCWFFFSLLFLAFLLLFLTSKLQTVMLNDFKA